MALQIVNLRPVYDSRASFYDKAVLHIFSEHVDLFSFGTRVATIRNDGKLLEIFGYYSMTTGRHIREFALQYGFSKDITKKMMENKVILIKNES